MKKYKILFFTKESRGGIESFLKQMEKIDHSQFIKKYYAYKKDSFSSFNNFHFFSRDYPKNLSFSLFKIILLLKNTFDTYTILLHEKVDILFTCDLYSSIIILIIKVFFIRKTKVICLINTNLIQTLQLKPNFIFRSLLIKVIKKLYSFANKIIFVSGDLAYHTSLFLKLNKEKYDIVYNGIDINNITKLADNEIGEDLRKIKQVAELKIISVGRLDRQKDFTTIIKAFSLLIKKGVNVSLFFIGDGELKSELIKLTEELKMKNYVYFLGWKVNIFPYLKLADIFVFSSLYEGFGRTILEAMTLRKPIISTNSPYGPSEILENDKYGILVPPGDHKKMTNILLQFTKYKSMRNRYGKLAYLRAKYFSEDRMLKKYKKIFISI